MNTIAMNKKFLLFTLLMASVSFADAGNDWYKHLKATPAQTDPPTQAEIQAVHDYKLDKQLDDQLSAAEVAKSKRDKVIECKPDKSDAITDPEPGDIVASAPDDVPDSTHAIKTHLNGNDRIIKEQSYVTFQKADYDELVPLIMQQDLEAIKQMAAEGRVDVIAKGTHVHLVHGTVFGPEQVRITGSTQKVWIDRHELNSD